MTAAQRDYLRREHIDPDTLAWEPGETAILPDGRALFPDGKPRVLYACEFCDGRFASDWTDEEAWAEYERVYGAPDPDPAVICDVCLAHARTLGYIPTDN